MLWCFDHKIFSQSQLCWKIPPFLNIMSTKCALASKFGLPPCIFLPHGIGIAFFPPSVPFFLSFFSKISNDESTSCAAVMIWKTCWIAKLRWYSFSRCSVFYNTVKWSQHVEKMECSTEGSSLSQCPYFSRGRWGTCFRITFKCQRYPFILLQGWFLSDFPLLT